MADTQVTTSNENNLPVTFEELSGMAKAFVQSGYFADTKALAQAIVKIQAGKELGLPPVYSMQNINMIRNRLCSSANTLALLVKRTGRYNYRIKSHTDTECVITFFENDNGKWAEMGESKFTIDDARRAELVKPDSGWSKYPRAMLFSRAISQGARIYCPDAIGGIYTDEEIRSIPPKPEDAEYAVVDDTTGEIKDSTPVTSPSTDDHFCSEHNTKFYRNEKDGKVWYSHKIKETGKYCNEMKPAEKRQDVKTTLNDLGLQGQVESDLLS